MEKNRQRMQDLAETSQPSFESEKGKLKESDIFKSQFLKQIFTEQSYLLCKDRSQRREHESDNNI